MTPARWRTPLLAGLIVTIALGSLALGARRNALAYDCVLQGDGGAVLKYHATTGMPLPDPRCGGARDAVVSAHDGRTWAYRGASLAVFLAALGLSTGRSRRTIRMTAGRAASLTGHRIARGPS